jgi:Nuclease-related domain
MAGPRSPLKDRPLRNPGQSLDEEIQRVIGDHADPYVMVVLALWAMTFVEWIGAWRHLPRQPVVFTLCAVVATAWVAWKVVPLRRRIKALRLGRDGERAVGQFLEGLREGGARIFHDIPADGFNLDHVVISTRGIYVVETKTVTKPGADAKVVYDGERVIVGGFAPDRDPIAQASAEATWLGGLLQQSTGRAFPIRAVVVYPRWWVEQTHKERLRHVWVLEPKALPKWIEQAAATMAPDEVAMAAYHLSRYVRGEERSKG